MAYLYYFLDVVLGVLCSFPLDCVNSYVTRMSTYARHFTLPVFFYHVCTNNNCNVQSVLYFVKWNTFYVPFLHINKIVVECALLFQLIDIKIPRQLMFIWLSVGEVAAGRARRSAWLTPPPAGCRVRPQLTSQERRGGRLKNIPE